MRLKTLSSRLFDAVDIAPLIFFRIAFGGLMLWEVWRYFLYDRIARYYVEPSFYFHYYGFDWLRPLPGDGMFLLFHFIGLLSALILVGFCYRLSMTLFWLCFSYIFLLDQAQYLNHFYLVSLVSFLMIFIPAHRALSIDALLRPSILSQVAPAWSLWLLRGQMAVVYFFGGLAKLNPDWFAGEPLRMWLSVRTDFPIIGQYFTEEWMVYLFSYGGLLLDLFIVPLLLWRWTRIPALIVAVMFHLTNNYLFNIGIFPWFAIASTLLFMSPHWFRVPLRWLKLGTAPTTTPAAFPVRRLILAGMALYFAIQILLPLRHWLYPGDPSWTEEGHTLAWHMRLRQKDGGITFYATDQTGMWQIPAESYLSSRQLSQMRDNPDMILRFAHHLAKVLEAEGSEGLQIRAWSMMSLNSRAPQLLIDPTADLVQQPDNLLASDWILPLQQHPTPSAPVPTALISRRYDDALVIVNITESGYPLDRVELHGADDAALNGSTFGITQLLPGECVIAHTEHADLSTLSVPCNETGSRQVISSALLDATLSVQFSDGISSLQTQCTSVVCVVPYEPA